VWRRFSTFVDEHHEAFNYINVATAVTRIAKLAREERRSGSSNAVTRATPLAADERYVKLMGLVVQELQSFQAREVANVFSGLATLLDEIGLLLTSTRCPVETHLTATSV
jgi:hypothetical protein